MHIWSIKITKGNLLFIKQKRIDFIKIFVHIVAGFDILKIWLHLTDFSSTAVLDIFNAMHTKCYILYIHIVRFFLQTKVLVIKVIWSRFCYIFWSAVIWTASFNNRSVHFSKFLLSICLRSKLLLISTNL